MKAKIKTTAQRLINLYRQAHVIIGGWATVNNVFINDATDEVIKELNEMPTGKTLVKHIENLRSGKTPIDSIERELLPYGGMMVTEEMPSIKISEQQLRELENAIEAFTFDQNGLDMLQTLPIIRSFGAEWPTAIRAILDKHPKSLEKWDLIVQTYNAYKTWNSAHEIISKPLSERTRAQVQADMPEFETYLPKFGTQGLELLERLRTFISSTN